MIDGVMLLWFAMTLPSVSFVAFDIVRTPESPVLKWAFVLIVLYTGPVGLFLYLLGCREPLAGLHERYVAARWRQVLGSTMHCVAGDGVGILAGAVIGRLVRLQGGAALALEYLLGFGFGWAVFQALFMRRELGGSYLRALRRTFMPEFVSMNMLMAGMVPVMHRLETLAPERMTPTDPFFWFAMSMALLAGFVVAWPVNWWLVARHLKHGMMTVRPDASGGHAPPDPVHAAPDGGGREDAREAQGGQEKKRTASAVERFGVAVLTVAIFALAVLRLSP